MARCVQYCSMCVWCDVNVCGMCVAVCGLHVVYVLCVMHVFGKCMCSVCCMCRLREWCVYMYVSVCV